MLRTIMLTATLAVATTPTLAGTYQDAMRTCGAEWRQSDARTHVAKGEGAKAWNAFRAECTKRVGWTTIRQQLKAIGTGSPSQPAPAASIPPSNAI